MTSPPKSLEFLIPQGTKVSFELPLGSGIIIVREYEYFIPSTSQAIASGALEIENIPLSGRGSLSSNPLSPLGRRSFRLKLVDHFTSDELRDLCFDMGIDDEGLPGATKSDLARELIKYCERRGLVNRLRELCRHQFPNIEW